VIDCGKMFTADDSFRRAMQARVENGGGGTMRPNNHLPSLTTAPFDAHIRVRRSDDGK